MTEYRYTVNNITKVMSQEDVMDAPCAMITVVVPLNGGDKIIFECNPDAARALATKLRKHANFLDPPKKRRRR
jgi:hypothetical protein